MKFDSLSVASRVAFNAPRSVMPQALRGVAALSFAVLAVMVAVAPAWGQAEGAANVIGRKTVKLVAPGATSIVILADARLAIVAQADQPDRDLSVFRLDEAGRPVQVTQGEGDAATTSAAPATPVKLPWPEGLAAAKASVRDMALHPTLPLLYLWRDAYDLSGDARTAAFEKFTHLVVMTIGEDGSLAPFGAWGAGPQFTLGESVARIAISPDGRRIFMPNLRHPELGRSAIGYYDLDAEGSPEPTPVPIEGSLDGFGLNKMELRILPTLVDTANFLNHPTGWGYVTVQRDVVAFGGPYGPAVWDTINRRGQIGVTYVRGMPVNSHIGAHPDVPIIISAGFGQNHLMSMDHAGGYPTLMPRRTAMSGARFLSPPVVLPGSPNRVAIGGPQVVYVTPLDDAGGFLLDQTERIAVNNPNVRAVAWDQAFDRLYVPVESDP